MRLLKVSLEGIRRFESTDALLVTDRLVAIVGPNEAGKTSLLLALEQIQGSGPLAPNLATRQCSKPPKIRALFDLEPEDLGALRAVHQGPAIRRAWVNRTNEGTTWTLEPRPNRDLAKRISTSTEFQPIKRDPAVASAIEDPENPFDESAWNACESLLASDADSLTADEIGVFSQVADALDRVAAAVFDGDVDDHDSESADDSEEYGKEQRQRRGQSLEALAGSLRQLVEVESEPAPARLAIGVLSQRLPSIVQFGDADRDLRSEYDLQETADEVPVALSNVAALGQLDLASLRQAIEAGDHGTTRLLREAANKSLMEFFDEGYSQSDVCLQLDTDGFILRLLVRAESGEDFIELSERSSGFQWFVALVAFLARHRHERPIVLIDEIETHLHYAAQADVIDVLVRQTVAPQVIYTTHSAGALPPDLGRGVRAVVPVVGRQRSIIDNSFWTSGPGFTPLLFGLGASTLALSIPRFVLITEGASDAVLLPTLIREVVGISDLPYRVAPGIANTPPQALHKLDEEGGRVVYLVDGDEGGIRHHRNLIDAGIDESRVVSLGALLGENGTPEDLLEPSIYVDAVNEEGAPFWGGRQIQPSMLPPLGRAKAVTDWCRSNGIEDVSKVRVAQRVIERSWSLVAADDPPVRPDESPWLVTDLGREALMKLHSAALAAMRLPGVT